MQSSEVYRLLARRIRRGLIIFTTLVLVTIVSSGVAMGVTGGGPWAVISLLAGILFYLAWKHALIRTPQPGVLLSIHNSFIGHTPRPHFSPLHAMLYTIAHFAPFGAYF